MKGKDFYKNLFIFEIANNHMGSLEHGLKIIRQFHEVSKNFEFKFGFKVQYRDLDTFIHPDFKDDKENTHIKRFLDARLSDDEFLQLKKRAEELGFLTACTPFDEISVKKVISHGYDILKIASCSFTDWRLLEEVAKQDIPIILSTAGASTDDTDEVHRFLNNRNKVFTFMHCRALYPTKNNDLHLDKIDFLQEKYSELNIGFSTHEDPSNMDAVKIAVSKGVNIFERHIDISSSMYNINAYSSHPSQIHDWLLNMEDALNMCGRYNYTKCNEEQISLNLLKRGVFAKNNLKTLECLNEDNTFLAIPIEDSQLSGSHMSKYNKWEVAYKINKDVPISATKDVTYTNNKNKIEKITNSVVNFIQKSKVVPYDTLNIQLSHHYGLNEFEYYGASIIDCVNREYCKKLIVLLPNQYHPSHYHVKKEETFTVLYGSMTVKLTTDDNVTTEHILGTGDSLLVERGIRHDFFSKYGVIFEEISTTHFEGDSFYGDKSIDINSDRKTGILVDKDAFL